MKDFTQDALATRLEEFVTSKNTKYVCVSDRTRIDQSLLSHLRARRKNLSDNNASVLDDYLKSQNY